MDMTDSKRNGNTKTPMTGTDMQDRSGDGRSYFFAGGGTGGHIYPGLAVAEQIADKQPKANISFFCSQRQIDSRILSDSGFELITLPAAALSLRPDKLLKFLIGLFKSYNIAKTILKPVAGNSVVTGVGGFVSVPVVLAAKSLKIPIALINVDIVPGKANKLTGRFADQIFVQFQETRKYLKKGRASIEVVGCPLRKSFLNPQGNKAIEDIKLDLKKKTLLIMGGSSGGVNINKAVCELLGDLKEFKKTWQIVHITGTAGYKETKAGYSGRRTKHILLEYYDDMGALMSVSELVVGRAGAVSIAEYAFSWLAAICVPYPYHRDKHQHLNALRLVKAGAAVIVDDEKNSEKTAVSLSKCLVKLMKNDQLREKMSKSSQAAGDAEAAAKIAVQLSHLH
jgi:UDP-N-acetylglucosamine--N-acetylmuramyl-(pentapeptide) pyrophosphoryl-undecaprenol N-acetylglucosamine transferase